jgi:hypothetical protein
MPWRPNSVGNKGNQYDERWRRIRAQTLRGEPLCRLCLAAGRTVPATVVDHKTPLNDGGTHEASNLQPLCKRCHDAIKTPADVAARERAASVGLTVIAVAFGIRLAGAGVMDQRVFRQVLATGCGWQTAHLLSLAALDGIIASAQRGDLPRLTGTIVTDDAVWAKGAASRLGVEVTIQPMDDESPSGPRGSEAAWLRERYGSERDARAVAARGSQAERALS